MTVRSQYLLAGTIALIGCVLLLPVVGNTQSPSYESEQKSPKTLEQIGTTDLFTTSLDVLDSLLPRERVKPAPSVWSLVPGKQDAPEPKSPVQEQANESAEADKPLVGKPAPDFELRMVSGDQTTMKLSDLKGKAVVLNFWASWCGPCKIEMPWFEEFQQTYREQGLQVIGIALEDLNHEEAAAEFAEKTGVHYTILVGTDTVADLYGGIDGLPQTFFIDRTGTIVEQQIGLESKTTIEANIRKALKEPSDADQSGPK